MDKRLKLLALKVATKAYKYISSHYISLTHSLRASRKQKVPAVLAPLRLPALRRFHDTRAYQTDGVCKALANMRVRTPRQYIHYSVSSVASVLGRRISWQDQFHSGWGPLYTTNRSTSSGLWEVRSSVRGILFHSNQGRQSRKLTWKSCERVDRAKRVAFLGACNTSCVRMKFSIERSFIGTRCRSFR